MHVKHYSELNQEDLKRVVKPSFAIQIATSMLHHGMSSFGAEKLHASKNLEDDLTSGEIVLLESPQAQFSIFWFDGDKINHHLDRRF
ncbi:hypothetical protein, partial [Shewanella sairae]|uniref:hypothetical protein n=2 Tax=Shewanella sairae TaxID=190310 RepID=UPI001C8062A6